MIVNLYNYSKINSIKELSNSLDLVFKMELLEIIKIKIIKKIVILLKNNKKFISQEVAHQELHVSVLLVLKTSKRTIKKPHKN
jgi:hypothetical protein